MEMFFLILKIGTDAVVMPQPYPKEQCEKLASGYGGFAGKCIPAPDDSEYFNCTTLIPNGNSTISAKIHCNIRTGK